MLQLFLTHLQGYKRQAVLSPILIVLEVICELLLPLVMAEIVDTAIPAGDETYIFILGAAMLALALIAMACGVGSAKYATIASQGFGANLRQCLFDKVQEFSFADIDRFSSASLITRMTNDVNAMTMMLAMGLRMKQARKLERQLDKIVGTRDNIPLDELFAAAGIDADRGRAAVERAIDHGYFGADAYIDNRTGTLVVRGAAPQPPRPAEPAPAPAPEDQYASLQRQLRQANDAIPDPVMTAKISRLEDVSARIFALAKKDPDKKAQLQKFMDYYLPTALKLLNTYAQLSAQDVQGTNITEAKQSIERSMDLLITAFENQLDKLFASDALDVSTDIAALEGMLNLDGLTGGDFSPRS